MTVNAPCDNPECATCHPSRRNPAEDEIDALVKHAHVTGWFDRALAENEAKYGHRTCASVYEGHRCQWRQADHVDAHRAWVDGRWMMWTTETTTKKEGNPE
ncbi:MAG: hypothetical protein KGL39_15915 [Patescibacteria group bacterium]|nr:hypothetical protein [Patescibacteria group bacterium]